MAVDGGKFIIIENGKPIMVIVPFEEYKNKLNPSFSKKVAASRSKIEEDNQNQENDLKAEDDFTVDDLPLE
jgi:antitoxin (DNA-binding transcriptional repressor) of toxin-antitoxin stability system